MIITQLFVIILQSEIMREFAVENCAFDAGTSMSVRSRTPRLANNVDPHEVHKRKQQFHSMRAPLSVSLNLQKAYPCFPNEDRDRVRNSIGKPHHAPNHFTSRGCTFLTGRLGRQNLIHMHNVVLLVVL